MSDKYFTVVYKVTDSEKFRVEASRITSAFAGDSSIEGCEVTGVGWEDSMTERDYMAEFLDQEGYSSDLIAAGESV